MARTRARPRDLSSPRVESTTIGLRPVEIVAAEVIAKRRRSSVSHLFRALLLDEIERHEGRFWEERMPEIAAREGVAA